MDKEAITQKGREDIVSGQPQIVEQLSDGSAGAEEHSPDTVAIVTGPLQDKVVDVAVLVADRDTRLVDLRRRQTIVSGQLEDIQQGEQVLRQTAHITSFVIQLKAEQLNQENGKETDRNDFSIDLGPNQPFNQGHGGETADHEGRLKLIGHSEGKKKLAVILSRLIHVKSCDLLLATLSTVKSSGRRRALFEDRGHQTVPRWSELEGVSKQLNCTSDVVKRGGREDLKGLGQVGL